MDTIRAIRQVSGKAPEVVWHKDTLPANCDLVVLPGGFSYGDYLRVGAIARVSPVMDSVAKHARKGGLVLGICNGFQILLEARLLPGAMMRNRNLHFICKWVHLLTVRGNTPFTRGVPQILRIPVAHATGNFFIEAEGLKRMEDRGQVLFRYCSETGEILDDSNPNGSLNAIAGITNEQGNVLGMMPHPERAIDPVLGSSDGEMIWKSVLNVDPVSATP
jgi:phosphoribosylformylglycinamidine synthase